MSLMGGADNDTAIKVEGLGKRFGDVQAVADVEFEVLSGEVFGFLGPNGAGKTTTINILTGLALPDTGTIHIGEIDCTKKPRGAQHLIGVVPDENNLYPELSGFDNLCFCAALYGMSKTERQARARELLEAFDLTKAASRKFDSYSKGMKRKLTIAAGIIHKPKILFLDEPTTGIDVASARHLHKLIRELNRNGTTIFLTTHYIQEAEQLCDRIAFIVSGNIVRVDSVENLVQPIQGKHVIHISCSNYPDDLQIKLNKEFPCLKFMTIQKNLISVEADESIHVGSLVCFLDKQGVDVLEARKIKLSLEDVFVNVTGIGADTMHSEKEKKGGKQ